MHDFVINAMSCGHCMAAITAALQRLDPEAKIEIDLAAKSLRVVTMQDRPAVARALSEAGYAPEARSPSREPGGTS